MRFELQAECPDTGARAGLLHTPHGIVETPVFMPVGTQATVKGVPQRDLEGELDARILGDVTADENLPLTSEERELLTFLEQRIRNEAGGGRADERSGGNGTPS